MVEQTRADARGEQRAVDQLCARLSDVGIRHLVARIDGDLQPYLPGQGASTREVAAKAVELLGQHGRMAELLAEIRRSRAKPRRFVLATALVGGACLVFATSPLWSSQYADEPRLGEALVVDEIADPPNAAPNYVHLAARMEPVRDPVRRRPVPSIAVPLSVVEVPRSPILSGEARCDGGQRCRLEASGQDFSAVISACLDVHVEGVQVSCVVEGDPRGADSVGCDRSDPASAFPLPKGVYRWRQCP